MSTRNSLVQLAAWDAEARSTPPLAPVIPTECTVWVSRPRDDIPDLPQYFRSNTAAALLRHFAACDAQSHSVNDDGEPPDEPIIINGHPE